MYFYIIIFETKVTNSKTALYLEELLKKISNYVGNEGFMSLHRVSEKDFSRERKLSFKDLFFIILGFSRTSLQTELDRFFKQESLLNGKTITLSKSAFSQSRAKFSHKAFIEMNDIILNDFETNALVKNTWKGKRLIAIDGSDLILPNSPSLKMHFGFYKNQNQLETSGAKMSVAYDVCNQLIISTVIGRINIDKEAREIVKSDEKTQVIEHLKKLNPLTDILIFDRGYPALWLFALLEKEGFKYCFRLSTAWKISKEFAQSSENEIYKTYIREYKTKGKEEFDKYELPDKLENIRHVKVILSTGEQEILATNLDVEEFDNQSMKKLYHFRWSVEENYKRVKNCTHVEFFSGKTVEVILQDVHARMLMLNIASLIKSHTLIELKEEKKKTNKHRSQLNFSQVIIKTKDYIFDIFINNKIRESLELIAKFLRNSFDIIRDDRHFKRNTGYKQRRKSLNYRGM